MSIISDKHNKVLRVLAEHKAKSDYARGEMQAGRFTQDGAFDAVHKESARLNWVGQLDEVAEWAQAFEDKADAQIGVVLKSITAPAGTVQEQQLAEARNARAWERLRRLFDTDGDSQVFFSSLRRLKETVDVAEISVLVAELPDYLAARGHEPKEIARFLNEAIAEVVPAFDFARRNAVFAGEVNRTMRANVRLAKQTIELLLQGETMALRLSDPSQHEVPTDLTGKDVAGLGVWNSSLGEFVPRPAA